ncbi:jg3643 [Pararge aegeria aegeria]|uniref:Jg3643 protein n=1 Tax=Pararge aegeria aegeria TaxID=348720 RepID=A0A8S4RHB3_9NEOP|nr:jg3643 [Pararge aegeria aegeria]
MFTEFSFTTLLISSQHFLCSLVVFFPCLIMEMISEDIENMRAIVADKMIICLGNDQGNECLYFLQCLRQRPMNYVIWRAFNMNFRLLLNYSSLVITYLICLLQFKPILINFTVNVNSTVQY